MSPIDELARRFVGVDVQYRDEWGWRAKLIASKNERAAYRIEVRGKTMDDAVKTLLDAVRAIDEGKR